MPCKIKCFLRFSGQYGHTYVNTFRGCYGNPLRKAVWSIVMQVNLKDFLNQADIKEELYPGKRLVKPCKHLGDFKNHCVIVDWRDPSTLKIEVKPGLSGKVLAPEMHKKYPVCFQMPTYVDIKVGNDNSSHSEDDDEDESKGKSGKGGSGGKGKKPAKKKLEDIDLISSRFGKMAEGAIPALGEIKEMVVMGVQIAKKSFASAFGELTRQISHAKIAATDILAKAADMVSRVQPPEYVKPTGDETVKYNYDREKNADIGMKISLG